MFLIVTKSICQSLQLSFGNMKPAVSVRLLVGNACKFYEVGAVGYDTCFIFLAGNGVGITVAFPWSLSGLIHIGCFLYMLGLQFPSSVITKEFKFSGWHLTLGLLYPDIIWAVGTGNYTDHYGMHMGDMRRRKGRSCGQVYVQMATDRLLVSSHGSIDRVA